MSGSNKRIRKKPDHESGFYEEYPAEDESSSSYSFNVNNRTSEDKMKKTIKNIKNRKKSDINPPHGFSTPDEKREEKIPANNNPVTPPSKMNSQRIPNVIDESENYVLILSDGEEEEEEKKKASTSNSSNTKENLKTDHTEIDPLIPLEERNLSCTVTGSYSQSDLELEQISKIRKYGGMFFS